MEKNEHKCLGDCKMYVCQKDTEWLMSSSLFEHLSYRLGDTKGDI